MIKEDDKEWKWSLLARFLLKVQTGGIDAVTLSSFVPRSIIEDMS